MAATLPSTRDALHRLEPWEREYQDAGDIEQAERMGCNHIGRDPRCSIEITEKGRSLVEHG